MPWVLYVGLPGWVKNSVFIRKEADEHSVDPAAGNDWVKSTHDDVKLRIEGTVKILNFRVAAIDGIKLIV